MRRLILLTFYARYTRRVDVDFVRSNKLNNYAKSASTCLRRFVKSKTKKKKTKREKK